MTTGSIYGLGDSGPLLLYVWVGFLVNKEKTTSSKKDFSTFMSKKKKKTPTEMRKKYLFFR